LRDAGESQSSLRRRYVRFAQISVNNADTGVVGRSNLYAYQYRSAANIFAKEAIDAFYQDANLTETFHALLDRKWDHMLDQAVCQAR